MSRKKTNKIEAETGEVVQSNRPFIIRNGGIAKPLGQGLYLLGGKTHEQGGIDIDFTGDARIFSAQPILNGNSPAELVARGANPNITFNRQERFKDVNGINDDGSRKAQYGTEEVSDNTRVQMPRTDVEPIKRNDKELRMEGWGTVDYGDGEAVLVPPPASGALTPVYPEFDLLTLVRSIATLPKGIRLNDKSSYYRQVERENKPIERAKEKGIIDVKSAKTRSVTSKGHTFNFGKTFDVPFFSKGKLWYPNNKKYDIIVGKDNPLLDWEMITQHGRLTKNAAQAGTRRTPYYMDEANQAPTELFELYRHYPIIGYREVTNGVPTIPITGISNLFDDENMNNSNKKLLGGRTKAEYGIWKRIENSKANFVKRLKDPNRKEIKDWASDGIATHKLGVATDENGNHYIYPAVQEINGELIDFTRPPYSLYAGMISAEERGDTVRVNSIDEGLDFTQNYKKKYTSVMNKKRLGGSTGLIRVQANGKDRLMYVPFTGEETKAGRKKAAFGIELNAPKLSYDFTNADKIMEGIKKDNNKKDWWKNNRNAIISGLGNIGASLTSYLINKNMLKDLDYAPTPVAKRAAKLKTNININPELTALGETLSRTIDTINANTASSRVANARNQASILNTTLAANKLYTDKENRETALINQDRLNQQEVANANIDAYNTWRTGKTTFENTIREQQSENAVSLVDNINKGIQTGITDIERRRQFRNNLAIMAAAYPNVTPALLKSYGADFLRMGGKVKLNKKK